MKKSIIAIILMLAMLCGCQSQSEEVYTTKQTDELVIYIAPGTEYWIRMAIGKFESLYGIEVTTVDFSKDAAAYADTVSAELMAGDGPDIIFPLRMNMAIAKAMKNDVFLDLTEYFTNDEEFNEVDYLENVFESGKYNGKQLLVPVTFSSETVIASTSQIENIGFSFENVSDIISYLDEMAACVPAAQQNPMFKQMTQNKNRFGVFMNQTGIEFLDYENDIVCEDEDNIRKFFESYKRYFLTDYDPDSAYYITNMGHQNMLSGEYYFYDAFTFDIDAAVRAASVLKHNGGYEIKELKSVDGSSIAAIEMVAAVSANSKNKVNAYNFIKILISEYLQNANRFNGIPIRKSSIEKTVKNAQATYTQDLDVNGFIASQLTDDEITEFIDKFSSFDKLYIKNTNIENLIFETMLPYFQDKQDYDTCFAELKSKLSLYLNE